MKFYLHHVGQKGSEEDFKKSIYRKIYIDEIENLKFENLAYKELLLNQLNVEFPNKYFNCWGVPEGADFIIKNLTVGDIVLLLENASIKNNGKISILCEVKVFIPNKFYNLSEYIWNDIKYPYIFFFNTIEINYEWVKFLDDTDYKKNYNPRGTFNLINPERFKKFNGTEQYKNYILEYYLDNHKETEDSNIMLTSESNIIYTNPDEIIYQNKIQELLKTLNKGKVEDTPQPLPLLTSTIVKKWSRDPLKASKAIALANYECEYEKKHKTFTSRVSNKNYTEAHHLIPIKFQDKFSNSIDVECNIVSLCPSCHKKIHLAIKHDLIPMITQLYRNRKSRLKKCGLMLTLNDLINMY